MKDPGTVADALTRPVHAWGQEDRARLQRCWYHKVLLAAGHPQSLSTCSAPAGFITYGFTVTTEVLNKQPKNGGMMRSSSEGCLQNDGAPNLPISKGQDFTSITGVYCFAPLVMFFQGKRCKYALSLRKALRI